MSESRNSSGESRRSIYIPKTTSSESRNINSESRHMPFSRGVTQHPIQSNPKPNYNNLDDIDTLIARLESEMPKNSSVSPKVNSAYESRRKKLEELRNLQKQAREEQERQRQIAKAEEVLPHIQQGNDELDSAIEQIKQMVKKPTPEIRGYTYWDDGESHNGESRW